MATEVTVSTGELAASDVLLNVGPQHPATHGVLRLALAVDDDRIARAEPIVGYMHRGAEKLFEARDYRQILVLANRHDWLSAFSNELGVVLAVERMLGMEVPVRAVWTRTLLAELNRVLNHLMFLGIHPLGLGTATPMATAVRAREAIQAVMEEISGGRMHYMFNQVGGVKQDLPVGWLDRVLTSSREVRSAVRRDIEPALSDDTFRDRTRGVGVLDAAAAQGFGVSGPIARATGLDLDLRRDDPYLAYADLPADVLRVVTRTEGDCLARFECLLEQIEVSLDVVEHCVAVLATIEPGPINLRLPKVLKAPEGATYAWTENPLGVNGYYLVSRGERTPWRLKLRSASFNNVQALPNVLQGARVRDLVVILGSMFFVVGDI
ncbi:MAG: NADH-quinone oxidoreductase subunit D, partial [Frankiaceae bacterium]|nr:NADH-quinone oxidoreductase subunit D [Frankiaceae bacterium]